MPHNKNKRILWLLNHTTLRECEVPLLRELGMEVFTPKVLPNWKEFRSGNVTYEYDDSLTIPPEDLAVLNEHNFYEDMPSLRVRSIMNKYFGIAMPAAFVDMTAAIVKDFKGRILLRAFGLDSDNTYHDLFMEHGGPSLMRRIYEIADRFWLAACYDNIGANEPGFFQRKTVFLPLGLADKFYALENSWEGTEKALLFVCPSITSSPAYYGKIYKSFKRHFGNLPYRIAGEQPTPVNDPRVLGKLPRDAYDRMMQQSAVMYYHSREERHLHYHPLEAIIVGMPLIYLSGGLLDVMAGENPQPGRCKNEREARKKIKRILNGDTKLIEEIRTAQRVLLEPFSHAFNKKIWTENFINGILKEPDPVETPIKKIAVILPTAYKGGSLNGAKNIARMIHFGSRAAGEPVDVVFSCVQGAYQLDEDFHDLRALGIAVRETRWEYANAKEHDNMLKLSQQPVTPPTYHGAFAVPRDGVCDFADCDHLLMISDRTERPLARSKPYSILIYDCLQRYVPEILGDWRQGYELVQIENARNASTVFVTTPQTGEDVVQYLGISPHNVAQLPMEFDPLDVMPGSPAHDAPYFLWTTNIAPHKNHMKALEALNIYYLELQGKLHCVISGVNTDLLKKREQNPSDGSYLESLANRLHQSGLLDKKIHIAGYMYESAYVGALSHAEFLWHPTKADNGTFSVVEAAWHATPSLSADYPQMRFMNARFGLNLAWQDAQSPRSMAEALKAMEQNLAAQRAALPPKTTLEKFSYRHQASAFWASIRETL